MPRSDAAQKCNTADQVALGRREPQPAARCALTIGQRSPPGCGRQPPTATRRAGGQIFRIQPPGFVSPARYQVGEEVPVYYFSNQPGQGRLVTMRELLKRFIIAAVLLLVAALLFRSLSSRVAAPPQSSESRMVPESRTGIVRRS